MEVKHVTKKEGNFEGCLKKTPKIKDFDTMITRDTVIYEDGVPIIIYKVLPQDIITPFKKLIFKSKFTKSARSNGLPTKSAIFGSLPRVPNRNNYCRITANTRNQAELMPTVLRFADMINETYKDILPEQYEKNLEIVQDNVVDDYVIKDTPFTTVNFNVNHAIKYHRDTGNFKNVYSNVFILKEGMLGGHLVCPEYGIAFEQSDGALILFDGQKVIHGVTPIKATRDKAYRASCVFYSLASMKNCYPYKEELERIKNWRDKVESRWRSDPNELTGYKKHQKNTDKKENND